MIRWKSIAGYVEPSWEGAGPVSPPVLFWRPKKGATFGYIRDGELFDAAWLYVCNSSKVSHFSLVNAPDDSAADADERQTEAKG